MGKDTMNLVSIAAATPGYVETFRYQDGGMERNIQDEFEARWDHIVVSRVVNWEIAHEADFGLSGWSPTDSLLLYITSYNLFVTEGMAYIGGRRFLEAGGEILDTADPATNTYYIFIRYTFSSDTFEYDYDTSRPTDLDTIKHLVLGTATWNTTSKQWSAAVDLRSSNTSIGAPATVSGSDAGPIFTIENTGAGIGLLVKGSDATVGESGVPQQLIIQGDGTKALTIYNAANSAEIICSGANQLKIQSISGTDAELVVKTLNGLVVASSIITTGEWQGTDIAAAYLGTHSHQAADQGGDYAWADITGFGGEPGAVESGTSGQAGTATTISRSDHNHDLGVHNHQSAGAGGDYAWADITGFGAGGTATTVSRSDHDHNTIYYTETEQEDWSKKVRWLDRWGSTGVTIDTYLNYQVTKFAANTTNWGYWMFRIPDTWNSSTDSRVVFLLTAPTAFSDFTNYSVEVSGYRDGETLSSTYNIDSGTTGSFLAGGSGSNILDVIQSSDDLNFDARDIVIVRFGDLDGIHNNQIFYILDAWIEYTV
jgi:hypothetical protein